MSEKQRLAEEQKVPGSEGREPSEGRWVAEPRDADPKREGDGLKRLTEDDRLDTGNPRKLQDGPDEEDVEEKIVEAGVEETKLEVDTELELTPRRVPGT
jgi:hypothetical protein